MALNSSSDIETNRSQINEDLTNSDFGSDNVRKKTVVNYDEILEKLGQMGKFQLRTFLWLCLPAFFPGIVIMSYTFTGGTPNYRLGDEKILIINR